MTSIKKVTPPIRPKQGKNTEQKIEDIKIEKDTSVKNENDSHEPEMTHEEFRDSLKPEPHPVDNIQDETLKKNIQSTEFVDVDAKNSGVEEDSNVKVNFMSNNYMEDLISKKTEQGKGKEDTSKPKEKTEPGAKQTNDILSNSSTGNDFSKDDFGDFAEVFMDIIDMGISTALRFWGKDTSTTAYELQADKKRRIVRQLTNLFMKYQAKFSLEFMLVITLIICYSVPFQKAQERRKLINAGHDPEPRGKGKPTK
jgi:hypothetical protein